MSTTQDSKARVIKPIFPYDHEILRKIDNNGAILYYNYHNSSLHEGNIINALDEELELLLYGILEPFDVIEKALVNSDNIPVANTIAMIRQNISNTIFEVCELINKKIGVIKITRIYENEINAFHRWGRCIDVKIVQPDDEDAIENNS